MHTANLREDARVDDELDDEAARVVGTLQVGSGRADGAQARKDRYGPEKGVQVL